MREKTEQDPEPEPESLEGMLRRVAALDEKKLKRFIDLIQQSGGFEITP